jgi:hypothetical protein
MNSSLLIIGIKHMQSKSLLIAIAAFAVTATGAQAFVGTNYLNHSGLSSQQVEAFTQARELRRKGEVVKARDVLVKAGVNEETLSSLREAARASHEAIEEAVEAGDFTAFRKAAEGSPLYDIVTTKADFDLFKQAHDLKANGKFKEAKEILTDLGLPANGMNGGRTGEGMGRGGRHHENFLGLTFEQRDALRVARQANDEETVKEILKEAGITEPIMEHKIEKHNWR